MDDVQPVSDTQTQALPLASSWNNATVEFKITQKPQGVASTINFPVLWADQRRNLIYSFGGEASFIPPISGHPRPLTLWTFSPDGKGSGTWSENTTSPYGDGLTRPAGGLSAGSPDAAWYLGGWSSVGTSPESHNLPIGTLIPVPGLTKFDFTTNEWSNQTATGYSPSGTAAGGGIQFVPGFGPKGILVAFGGDTSDRFRYTPNSLPRNFALISVYEPSAGKWYTQTATGEDIPDNRSRFCVVGTRENKSSNGSYEVFMYGGVSSGSGAANNAFDQVWTLSIPSFRWFKADYTPRGARATHSCNVVGAGQRQMISIGGYNASRSSAVSGMQIPDEFAQGLGIFDLSEMKWTDGYDVDAPAYTRPSVVEDWYSKNGSYPESWDQPALKDLIQNNITAKSTSGPDQPAPAASTTASASSAPTASVLSPNNTPKIIGGVVGGVIGLLLILLAILVFFIRKRQRARRQHDDGSDAHPIPLKAVAEMPDRSPEELHDPNFVTAKEMDANHRRELEAKYHWEKERQAEGENGRMSVTGRRELE
ncbi:MAG: holocytochrome c synthase [Chaenotheca gracillima]|nr:MAG: holocytochrome c synthase [Chaenotheca gracillima]